MWLPLFEMKDQSKKSPLLSILIAIAISFFLIGELASIMHWPNKYELAIISTLSSIILIGLMIVKAIKKEKRQPSDYFRILFILAVRVSFASSFFELGYNSSHKRICNCHFRSMVKQY